MQTYHTSPTTIEILLNENETRRYFGRRDIRILTEHSRNGVLTEILRRACPSCRITGYAPRANIVRIQDAGSFIHYENIPPCPHPHLKKVISVLKFNRADPLLDQLEKLYGTYRGESRLYSAHGFFYLVLNGRYPGALPHRNAADVIGCLEEYGTLISGNAVMQIGKVLKTP